MYEADREWPADDHHGDGLAGDLAGMCEEELGKGGRVRALWLSGPEGPARAEALDGLADVVGPLDPFGGRLTHSLAASREPPAGERPACAFAVAAGLACRSTEEE